MKLGQTIFHAGTRKRGTVRRILPHRIEVITDDGIERWRRESIRRTPGIGNRRSENVALARLIGCNVETVRRYRAAR